MIEVAKNGISAGSFCDFITKNFALRKIAPSLVINPERLKEFFDMTIISKLQVKVARLQNGTIFDASKKTAVGKVINFADETNSDNLDYTLSIRRRNASLKRSHVRKLIDGLLKYEDTSELKKLIVTGKFDEDNHKEIINFIDQKLEDKITVKKERIISSFDVDERYDKMLEVYNQHKVKLRSVYKIRQQS